MFAEPASKLPTPCCCLVTCDFGPGARNMRVAHSIHDRRQLQEGGPSAKAHVPGRWWRRLVLGVGSPPPATWTLHASTNCYAGAGAEDLETPSGSSCCTLPSRVDCFARCDATAGCEAVVVTSTDPVLCYRRRSVDLSSCAQGDTSYDTYCFTYYAPKAVFYPCLVWQGCAYGNRSADACQRLCAQRADCRAYEFNNKNLCGASPCELHGVVPTHVDADPRYTCKIKA
ncbi:hypothetical protein EMIHUDRAFT_226704 [Emiliania huxleyi CCMP1516]|uniref:BPTI/Kunitz inhibitor domain-containing protein n=2 Tax=Emiliania huxleyi TaxID=2903 RepID=A0A0D3KK52_EMIH1|nr:hypothetical protein EMIHUDRAFT_226704 [Emiliania huxleyi CCMP1516]EOD36137.1 hypothetical protein EMIHUDRAFT_226704 [Emiliania huxleyi CCMP1516]|eukprot:XP_005788566.1 hypothetical protein EMIHUDRAFT_226704 [Emiliania huxleyi CCMP1516]